MIDQNSIQKLLEISDIVDVIEHYIPLKRSGSNYIGLCPFHDDKNPSMSVSRDKGFFHCFSCKAGGDVIKFIMDYERLSYPEAVEKLASLCNFTLTYTNKRVEKREDRYILEKLNAYYQSVLYKNPEALRYLHDRGIDKESIERFSIGYAPSSQNTLRLLENEKIELEEAIKVGAIKRNEQGVYASFINRITFPIFSHTGKLIGFGGRTLGQSPAKYVNSPEGFLFDKSRVLYGYNIAKTEAFKSKKLIITEGYIDVIMLHKAGFKNVVAVLGTALTASHLPLIKKEGLSVTLSFDGDGAGFSAAFKSAKLLTTHQIDCSVALLEGGADPADMVMSGKIREIEKIFSSAQEGGRFVIKKISEEFDLSRPQQKQNALLKIIEYTKTLPKVVAQDHSKYVSNLLNIPKESFSLTSFEQQSKKSYVVRQASRLRDDPLELSVLKFSVLNRDFKEQVLPKLEKFFLVHKELFEAIVKKSDDSPEVRELLLNDGVYPCSSKDLKRSIINLNLRYLRAKMEKIRAKGGEDMLSKIEEISNMIKKIEEKL